MYYDTTGHDYTDGIIVYSLDELRAFWRQCYRQAFRIIFRPVQPIDDFPAVCQLVLACEDMTFVVEELDTFFVQGHCCDEFQSIIRRGRHQRIELIGVSQRPFGFGRDFTSQAKAFYIFNTREPRDVKYIQDYLGSLAVVRMQQLDPEQYQYVAATEPFNDKDITIRKDKYHDSGIDYLSIEPVKAAQDPLPGAGPIGNEPGTDRDHGEPVHASADTADANAHG